MVAQTLALEFGIGFSVLSDDEKIAIFKQPRPMSIRFKRPAKTLREQAAEGKQLDLPGTANDMVTRAVS